MLIQYLRSYIPYLEAVSSIRNLRTRHAVVTRDSPYMDNNNDNNHSNVRGVKF
jgi:hypothetical protein